MKRSLMALAALFASTTALAQVYIGIGTGPSRQNVDCTGTSSCDTSDTGYKLYGGYRFNHLGAIELGYTDFGNVNARVGAVSATYSATAFTLGGTVFVPLAPRLTGIGRLGVASSEASVSGTLGFYSVSDSETHTNPYFGLALAYALTPKFSLTGSYDFSRIKYNGATSSTSLFAIGLSHSF
ncbi:MAG: outer membrane beta-barrel protein [Rhizobacter sp.]|nr:outer membrane beta-barrel protein [Rhizobacter sp.]